MLIVPLGLNLVLLLLMVTLLRRSPVLPNPPN
jgi:hypothetical protein